ncbi:MAG: hypothetical protein LC635_02100 [Pseudonocardiaceae bacterium]|nr:hypothetical protein [Pseudonocardiaceae bacterium]
MPVERAGADQVGEHELVEHRRLRAGAPQRRDHRVDERARQHEPCQPQRRGQRRARVHHTFRRQRLQCADLLAVEAELAVVVVLDDDRAGPGECRAAGRRHRDAERRVVRRGDDHRRARQLVQERAALELTGAITRLSETRDVPDEVYEYTTKVFTESQYQVVVWLILIINGFNRLAAPARPSLPKRTA